MNEKMQVLIVKQTGHVLAAFTRTADPEDKPAVSALAGSGLLVRNRGAVPPPSSGVETFLVSSGSLDVAVVDFDPDVFLLPSRFAASGGKVEPLGPVAPSSVTLAVDKLTIAVANANAPSSNLKVWAQVEKVVTPTDSEPVKRVMVPAQARSARKVLASFIYIRWASSRRGNARRICYSQFCSKSALRRGKLIQRGMNRGKRC